MSSQVPRRIIHLQAEFGHILGGVVSGSNCGSFIFPRLLPRIKNDQQFWAEAKPLNRDTKRYNFLDQTGDHPFPYTPP